MEINKTHKQFYLKGVEDFSNFFINMVPEPDKESLKNLISAIKEQLERNINLIIELNKTQNKNENQ